MKTNLLNVILLLLCGIVPASGEMMLYTFEGAVYLSTASYDAPTVTYQFFVDTDLPGSLIDDAGDRDIFTTYTTPRTGTDTTINYFFTDLVGNGALPDLTTGDNSEQYMGLNVITTTTTNETTVSAPTIMLVGGSFSHYVALANNLPSINNWGVGTYVDGFELSQPTDLGTAPTILASGLRLTSIVRVTEPVNVPEPSTLLLLLSGCAILLITIPFRRLHKPTDADNRN